MPIPKINTISFKGYKHPLKTMYLRGQIPIKYGIYGETLRPDNCSLEHIVPTSLGGKTTSSNLALTSIKKNSVRGNKPLEDFLRPKDLAQYLYQFWTIKVGNFNGKRYVENLINTIQSIVSPDIMELYNKAIKSKIKM